VVVVRKLRVLVLAKRLLRVFRFGKSCGILKMKRVFVGENAEVTDIPRILDKIECVAAEFGLVRGDGDIVGNVGFETYSGRKGHIRVAYLLSGRLISHKTSNTQSNNYAAIVEFHDFDNSELEQELTEVPQNL